MADEDGAMAMVCRLFLTEKIKMTKRRLRCPPDFLVRHRSSFVFCISLRLSVRSLPDWLHVSFKRLRVRLSFGIASQDNPTYWISPIFLISSLDDNKITIIDAKEGENPVKNQQKYLAVLMRLYVQKLTNSMIL